MDRCKLANDYHSQGFNCSQSVLAAFSDLTGLSVQDSCNVAGGFGAGAGTGELCGAGTGAIMTLGLMTPVDLKDPVGSKKKDVALSKEFQKRFTERFGALRCSELLQNKAVPTQENAPAAVRLGVTSHCSTMIVTAVEIVEEMLSERA